MSKMDNLRAMREARYDEAAARSKGATPRKPAARPAVAPATQAEDEPKVPGPALCGHRAISGRVCTRAQGHTEKSHRYS